MGGARRGMPLGGKGRGRKGVHRIGPFADGAVTPISEPFGLALGDIAV
jgi:hypothetical protein